MRAVCLALALVLAAPAAGAAELSLIEAVAALGPQDLRVSEGLAGPLTGDWARVAVERGVMVIEINRGEDGRQVFHYDGKGYDRNNLGWKEGPDLEIGEFCDGSGKDGYYEIQCFSRSALRSRALRPPYMVWELWVAADGRRVVRESEHERLTLTPRNPAPKAGRRWLDPGLASNLGDAMAQLAANRDGFMFGGSSGGGDWYGSDLQVSEVKGLDFKLERTVMPDRGGRSKGVPATWSFDYQGPDRKDPSILTWFMYRIRAGAPEADFWCVGRHVSGVVDVACHKGGKPSDVKGRPDVAFKLAPFPKWTIYIEKGADNAFSSVGSAHLEPLPFP